MAIRDLKEKYGKTKPREALNAAIRAELIGGNELLDALANLDQFAAKSKSFGLPFTADAQQALDICKDISGMMRAEIARRYDLKSTRPD